VAAERGDHELADDGRLVADKLWTNKTNPAAPRKVMFPQAFDSWPVVLAQVQTVNGPAAVTDRIVKTFNGMFAFCIQEEETGGTHPSEQVGYIAVSQDATCIGGTACEAKRSWVKLKSIPAYVGTALGGTQVFVEEEQSADSETQHWIAEYGSFLGLGGEPPYVADLNTCRQADTSVLRCKDAMQVAAQISVSAQGPAGPLAGVPIRLSHARTQRLTTGARPVRRACPAGRRVRLAAPASFVRDGKTLSLSHWELDGRRVGAGRRVLTLRLKRNRRAVAVYAAEAP